MGDSGGVAIGVELVAHHLALGIGLGSEPTGGVISEREDPGRRVACHDRSAILDEEGCHLITVDPHSPGHFRSVGPLMNFQEFYDAFGIKPGAKMWRNPDLRAKIW